MDAAGKDGAIEHVMSGVNPQGCQVFSFKHPSADRTASTTSSGAPRAICPSAGKIGIFNRSYYEEVLIARVHPEILRGEGPAGRAGDDKTVWQDRYQSIVGLERHLDRNGTRIVKFFLHLSKEEQRKRFLARIDDPEKNWKFSQADIEERKYWKQYMKAYEKCLSATSTKHAPWYVVPADDKLNARLIVSRILLDTVERLKLEFPTAARDAQERAAEAAQAIGEVVRGPPSFGAAASVAAPVRDPGSGHEHRGTLESPGLEVGERLIRPRESIRSGARLDAYLRRQSKKVDPVLAREIGDRFDLALFPQPSVRHSRNVRHMDAGANNPAAPSVPPAARAAQARRSARR